jgi:hypothetical protein
MITTRTERARDFTYKDQLREHANAIHGLYKKTRKPTRRKGKQQQQMAPPSKTAKNTKKDTLLFGGKSRYRHI